MLDVVYTSQFKRDYRLAMRRHLDITKLDAVIELLANKEQLSPQYRDHQLSGKWAKYRELHIEPDWLLVYRIDQDVLVLTLSRTGTHSDLFD